MKKRLIAIILVLTLLLLSGCENKKPGTVTESPVPVEPTAGEIFAQKAAQINALDSFSMELDMTQTNTVGTYTYETECAFSAEYALLTSDTPIAKVKMTDSLDGEAMKQDMQYVDGRAYLKLGSDTYVSEMTMEDYQNSMYPAIILDPANYNTVTYDAEKGAFQFKDATALEDWLTPEYAQLLDAEGTATLDADGMLETMTYKASYIQGPVTIETSFTVELSDTDLTVEDVHPKEDAVSVSDIYIPVLLGYTDLVIEQMPPVSGYSTTKIMSQALGFYYYQGTELDIYGEGKEGLAKTHQEIQIQDAYESAEITATNLYKDGHSTYTVKYGTSEESVEEDVDLESYYSYAWAELTYSLLELDSVENAVLTGVGDYLLIEYDLTEDNADTIQFATTGAFMEDPTYLDEYVEELKPVSMTGWVSVDRDTLLPTSFGINAEIIQVIEEKDYTLTFETIQNFEIGDPDAYENIMDEPIPDVEPENKPTPLLYEVTDSKGGKLYLLGTIHIGDDATGFLPATITDALKASDALALEINVDTIEERFDTDEKLLESYMTGMLCADGKLTADMLDEETAKQLEQMIKAYGKQSYMEYFLPSALESYFTNTALDRVNGLYSNKGVEERLIQYAKDAEIEIIEVEDAYESLAKDSKYSEKTQLLLLEEGLKINRAQILQGAKELYEAWCSGDETQLREMLRMEDEEALQDYTEEERAAYEEYEKIMVSDRDAQMLEKAKEYIVSGDTVFMAVGTAHVLGETGLVDALREAGFTVTKVEH